MSSQNILLIGGAPIYRNGLIEALCRWFPSANICEEPTKPQFDLSIYLFDKQSCADGMLRLKRSLSQSTFGRILIIGPFLKTAYVKSLLRAGAAGYVLRDIKPDKLEKALKIAMKGETYIDPALPEKWMHNKLGLPSALPAALTKREREVLQLIVEGLTTDEIAGRLFISRCTVESHRANILGKLGVRNVAGIVREAIRRDLCAV